MQRELAARGPGFRAPKSRRTADALSVRLSGYEFRAFYKKTGRVALHLRSHLLVRTKVAFGVTAYLESITGSLSVPGFEPMELHGMGIDEAAACAYDGASLVHGLRIDHLSDLPDTATRLAALRLAYRFNFHGSTIDGNHENPALIVPGRSR